MAGEEIPDPRLLEQRCLPRSPGSCWVVRATAARPRIRPRVSRGGRRRQGQPRACSVLCRGYRFSLWGHCWCDLFQARASFCRYNTLMPMGRVKWWGPSPKPRHLWSGAITTNRGSADTAAEQRLYPKGWVCVARPALLLRGARGAYPSSRFARVASSGRRQSSELAW